MQITPITRVQQIIQSLVKVFLSVNRVDKQADMTYSKLIVLQECSGNCQQCLRACQHCFLWEIP